MTLTAFVACYGRVFSGKSAHQGLPAGIGEHDRTLHDHLMELRDQAVAHSDWQYRAIRLLPPGAAAEGVAPVPAHHIHNWRWFVHALELHADHDHVERWLRSLQKNFEARTAAAFARLYDDCKDDVLPATQFALDDL